MVTLIGIEEHWTLESIDQTLRNQPPVLRDGSLVLNEHGDAAALVRRHPDRFRAMATLPLADPAAAAIELERAAALGLTGAMVYGRTGDVLLDDPRFDDLWTVAASLRQPIFIHPQIEPSRYSCRNVPSHTG